MSYTRVIPRGLFNEANLLKCYGQLALLILDNSFPSNPQFKEPSEGDSYTICMDDSDGSLFIDNLQLFINGNQLCNLRRPMNSRYSYLLYLRDKWDGDEIVVFNEDETFTQEMIKFLNKK